MCMMRELPSNGIHRVSRLLLVLRPPFQCGHVCSVFSWGAVLHYCHGLNSMVRPFHAAKTNDAVFDSPQSALVAYQPQLGSLSSKLAKDSI